MPELGCNFSLELVSLIREGRADVDWIKLSRWDAYAAEFPAARSLRPVLLHVLPHAGSPRLEALDWNALNQALLACGSPHIALHLASLAADWEGRTPCRPELVERLVAGIRLSADRLAVPLVVENVPPVGLPGLLPECADPAVIAEVCRRTGAALLLDLAHVRVAAWHRREDARTYLHTLPLRDVREIHVCGPEFHPEQGLRDRHGEMQAEDYALLSDALEVARPAIVTLEYGGTGPRLSGRTDPVALQRQLSRLAEMCGRN
ncbi:MAG: DUF692 family protein [Alicyclobacillus sp.]|nr:DUF692 family protein [Alicyclobacillus sp.]